MFNEASKNAELSSDCKLFKTFQWIYVENSPLSTVTNTNHFIAVLETGISDFYGHIFQIMYTLCYKHICLELTHEHDYLMCTIKSKGLAGHMLTTELYTCPQLHYRSVHASNYKSLGNLGIFLVLFFPPYLYTTDLQNITNLGSEIYVFFNGFSTWIMLSGRACFSKQLRQIIASMHLTVCQSWQTLQSVNM